MAGCVHPFPQKVVPGRKHGSGHRLSNWLLASVSIRYCKGPSLTLEKAAWFARDFLFRSGFGLFSSCFMSPYDLLAHDGRLNDNGSAKSDTYTLAWLQIHALC